MHLVRCTVGGLEDTANNRRVVCLQKSLGTVHDNGRSVLATHLSKYINIACAPTSRSIEQHPTKLNVITAPDI